MAEPKSKTLNIYEELRAQRAEMPGGDQIDDDTDLALASPWLLASLGCAVLSLLLSAVDVPDSGPVPWWTPVAIAARDPVGVSAVVWLAIWTGLVAEAKGQSRLRYTLWALLTPGLTTLIIIDSDSAPEPRHGREPSPGQPRA